MRPSASTVRRPEPANRHGTDPLRWFALLLPVLFVLQGLVFIPCAGVQNDEALFASGIYQPLALEFQARVFHRDVPLMLMSYIGALKVWLYAAIFKLWPPSLYSIRVPVLLLGAAAVWLFWRLLRDTLGRRAALIGCALLATDTSFLLTTCFDWGPVALQHLLLLGGLVLLAHFHQRGDVRLLAAGFFVLGVALWDKAIFAWMLVGLAAATAAVFPHALKFHLTWRNLIVAAVALLLGAAPLVGYNLRRNFSTWRSNAHYSAQGLAYKARVLEATLDGSSLIGYLVREQPGPRPGQAHNALQRASLAVSDAFCQPRTALLFPAVVLSLLLLPLFWRTPARPAALFALVFMAVTWAQMAFLQDAGGGAHHVVLLWPFPQLVVAAALAQVSIRWRRAGLIAVSAAVAVICASQALVTNEHLALFVRNGPALVWSDAVDTLAEKVEKIPARHFFVMDWGMMNTLRLLDRGRLPLAIGSDPVMKQTMDDQDRRFFEWMIAQPDSVFLAHTAGSEVFAAVPGRFEKAIRAAGLREHVVETIPDSLGRPTFEIYKLVKSE